MRSKGKEHPNLLFGLRAPETVENPVTGFGNVGVERLHFDALLKNDTTIEIARGNPSVEGNGIQWVSASIHIGTSLGRPWAGSNHAMARNGFSGSADGA